MIAVIARDRRDRKTVQHGGTEATEEIEGMRIRKWTTKFWPTLLRLLGSSVLKVSARSRPGSGGLDEIRWGSKKWYQQSDRYVPDRGDVGDPAIPRDSPLGPGIGCSWLGCRLLYRRLLLRDGVIHDDLFDLVAVPRRSCRPRIWRFASSV